MKLKMISESFDDHYCPEPNSGCWLWERCLHSKGYGMLWADGKMVRAHRFSWERANGPIPSGLCVLHKCDVPLCVNPEHLWLGTNGDNVSDRDRKGRQARGKTHHNGAKTHCKHGHHLAGEGIYMRPNGHRVCRICKRRYDTERRARIKART